MQPQRTPLEIKALNSNALAKQEGKNRCDGDQPHFWVVWIVARSNMHVQRLFGIVENYCDIYLYVSLFTFFTNALCVNLLRGLIVLKHL